METSKIKQELIDRVEKLEKLEKLKPELWTDDAKNDCQVKIDTLNSVIEMFNQ